jgi:glycosyltransferase involved in cell wall biosynthesis
VVHNGVAPRWFELKRVPDITDPFFLFVGNLKPHKNLKLLLAAFESVSLRIPHRLIVVGQSEGFITSDKDSLTRSNNSARVAFAGAVPDEQLDKLMSKASALIVPSFYEGFGLPALEALAAGLPVVASDIPPLKEVCGDLATYFDPTSTEALAEALLAVSRVRREQECNIGQRGRARAHDFSWERAGRSYRNIFAHTAGVSC